MGIYLKGQNVRRFVEILEWEVLSRKTGKLGLLENSPFFSSVSMI